MLYKGNWMRITKLADGLIFYFLDNSIPRFVRCVWFNIHSWYFKIVPISNDLELSLVVLYQIPVPVILVQI